MSEMMKPRTIECYRCGNSHTEELFGEGHFGWSALRDCLVEIEIEELISGNPPIIKKHKTKVNPVLCPDCIAELDKWLETKVMGGK